MKYLSRATPQSHRGVANNRVRPEPRPANHGPRLRGWRADAIAEVILPSRLVPAPGQRDGDYGFKPTVNRAYAIRGRMRSPGLSR